MKANSSVMVFVTRHIPIGGIESHIREFCTQLVKAGAKVDLVILSSDMLPETEAFYRRICDRVYLGKGGNVATRIGFLLKLILKINLRHYNAIYTNGQGDSVIAFSKLLFRKNKWVHHHHTSGDAKDQLSWTKGYRKALQSADAVIACSNRNAADMKQTLKREILSIPCFSRELKINEQPKREKLHFGYYGRLIPEKGIDLLCSLSEDKDTNGIEFHIWGKGEVYPADYFSSYPNIRYHGPFSGADELGEILSDLDAYLLLSTHPEGLPIALLEVMSVGLPWIATDCGGIPDIAVDPLSTRVIPLSLKYPGVKKAILDLALDIREGKLVKSKQKELYANKFSHTVLVERWAEVLGI